MAKQHPRTRHPVTWVVLTILILAPIVGTIWVPFYARTTPIAADFPFFYWYQLLWVPIVAVTSALAYALIRVTGDRRRGPGAPAGSPRGAAGARNARRADGTDTQRPGTGEGTV